MTKIEIVCWKDRIGGEIKSEVVEAFSYGFTVGPHGEWEMVIANEDKEVKKDKLVNIKICLLYTSPSPRDISGSRMPSSA